MPFTPNTQPTRPTSVGQPGNLAILQSFADAIKELQNAGLLIDDDIPEGGGSSDPGTGSGLNVANPVTLITGRAAPKAVMCCQDNAAVYDKVTNKTFLSYLGIDRALYVKEYDHATQTWTDDTFVGAYPADPGIEDDHGTPSLTIAPNGQLLVVYGAHITVPMIARSNVARSTTGGWTVAAGSSVTNGTYHSLITAGGAVWMMFRPGAGHNGSNTTPETYPSHAFAGLLRSTDNGSTWTDVGPIVDNNVYNSPSIDRAKDFYYSGAKAWQNSVCFAWGIAHGAAHDGPRADVYWARYDTVTGKLFSAAGTDLGTRIDTKAKLDACLVFRADAAQGMRFLVEDDGTVIGAAGAQTSDDQIGLYFCKFAPGDTAWTVKDIGARRHYAFADHHIARKEGGGYVIYAPTGREGETTILKNTLEKVSYVGVGHDITAFSTTDFGTTWDAVQVMSRWQTPGQGLAGVTCPENAQPDLAAIAVCGAVSGGVSGGLPTDRLAMYGISQTTANAAGILAAASISTKSVQFFNRKQVLNNPTKPAAGAWQTISLDNFVPFNVTRALLDISWVGNGVPGRVTMTFRRSGTQRDADASITRDAGSTVPSGAQVWVPVGPGKTFDWQLGYDSASGGAQIGAIYLNIVAVETEGGGASTQGRPYPLNAAKNPKYTPPGSISAPTALTLTATPSGNGSGEVVVTVSGGSGATSYGLYLGTSASGTLLTTSLGSFTYTGTPGVLARFYAVATNSGGSVNASGSATPTAPAVGVRPSAAPSTASQPTLWLRPDQVSSSVADGGAVTSWPAAVGQAAAVNTGNGGTAPTLLKNVALAGGQNAVRFTASAKNKMQVTVADLPSGRYRTYIVVANIRTLGANFLHGMTDADAAANFAMRMQVGSDGSFVGATFGIGTGAVSAAGKVAANSWHVFSLTFDGAETTYSPKVYLDGVLVGTGVGASGTVPSTLTKIALGGYGTGTVDVDYGDVIGIPALLSDIDRKSWESYVAQTYGVALAS